MNNNKQNNFNDNDVEQLVIYTSSKITNSINNGLRLAITSNKHSTLINNKISGNRNVSSKQVG